MTVHELRRWSDKVDREMLRRWSDRANNGLKATSEAAKDGMNAVYTKAMNNPRTATAVVLGAGVAAAVLWLVKRNGTFSSRRKQTLARVRKAPARAKRAARAAA